jgi:hypothetical protein
VHARMRGSRGGRFQTGATWHRLAARPAGHGACRAVRATHGGKREPRAQQSQDQQHYARLSQSYSHRIHRVVASGPGRFPLASLWCHRRAAPVHPVMVRRRYRPAGASNDASTSQRTINEPRMPSIEIAEWRRLNAIGFASACRSTASSSTR